MAEVRLYVVFMWFSALFIWHVFCYFDLILLFIKSIISRISFLYFYVQLLCTLLRVLVFRFYCGPIPHLVVCFLLFYFCHSFYLKCLQLCRSLFFIYLLFFFFMVKNIPEKPGRDKKQHLTNIKLVVGTSGCNTKERACIFSYCFRSHLGKLASFCRHN